jgi:hypothetical protein
VRGAAAFAGAPVREAAREGTIICASANDAGMDRSGRSFEWGVARIHLAHQRLAGFALPCAGDAARGDILLVGLVMPRTECQR